MPGRTYSREFKLTIVRQVANGEKRPASETGADERTGSDRVSYDRAGGR